MHLLRCGVVCLLTLATVAQDDAADLISRVQAGGWFEKLQYRRNDAGVFEVWSTAHLGDAERGEFVGISGFDFENIGLLGYLALACHGDTDLVAMTDLDVHCGALGIGTDDVALRQHLAVMPTTFAGERGRAELFDRLLVIDRLMHRGCRSATAELTPLAANGDIPSALQQRARQALDHFAGKRLARGRLDPAAIRLPMAFDGCVVIDHQRLPDMRWVAPVGRRLGALITAAAVKAAGGSVSPSMANGAQQMTDLIGLAPFWVAHQIGNARFDHSMLTINVRADDEMPVAVTWNAVGAFEAERWASQKGVLAERFRQSPLARGALEVQPTTWFASTDTAKYRPRAEVATRYVAESAHGVVIHVPSNSKAWAALAFLQLPSANGAVLRIAFGDPATLELTVEARDEDSAEAWVAKGTDLLAQGKAWVEQSAELVATSPRLQALLAQLLKVELRTADRQAVATVKVAGITSAGIQAMVEECLHLLL